MTTNNKEKSKLLEIELMEDSRYLPQSSEPNDNIFIFLYKITLVNKTSLPLKLVHMSFKATDANGKITDIQNKLQSDNVIVGPKDTYQNSTKIKLPTPIGSIITIYEFLYIQRQKTFKIETNPTTLSIPNILN